MQMSNLRTIKKPMPLLLQASAIAFLLALIMHTLSINTAHADDEGRYTMLESKDGIIRLDKKTGAMSTCKKIHGTWKCSNLASKSQKRNYKPESFRDDFEGNGKHTGSSDETIAMLKMENLKLKQRIADLEANTTILPKGENEKRLNLPSDEEVDEAITYMEKMIRKFRGAMKRMHKDNELPETEL